MGFQYEIKQNTGDSHQVNAWAGITFLTYKFRDTAHNFNRRINNADIISVNNVTVTSDILRIQTNSSKASYMTSAEVMLASGQFNYQSLLAPGDHALIWINNGANNQQDVMYRASQNRPANEFSSGLKFVGKVNSVRSVYNFMPDGTKTLRYMVTLKGFSEFSDLIYYNPGLDPGTINPNNPDNPLVFQGISKKWTSYLLKNRGLTDAQDLLQFCIDVFLGPGPSQRATISTADYGLAPNNAFVVPRELLSILDLSSSGSQFPTYANVINTLMGIQNYPSSITNSISNYLPFLNQSMSISNRYFTKNKLSGNLLAVPDMFNNVAMWSILEQASNSAINELYTSLKYDNNKIVPMIVARQVPFSSIYYEDFFTRDGLNPNSFPYTKFLELPRWVIDPSIAISQFNIGTSDATRFNFFQAFAALYSVESANPGADQAMQLNSKNFFLDNPDIMRNGNRPLVRTTTAILNTLGQGLEELKYWSYILADAFVDGHLKLSGNLICAGINEPICVGDNLQITDKLFHIEGVGHTYEVTESGAFKTFYTSLSLSQGVLTNGEYVVYEDTQKTVFQDPLAPGFNNESVQNSIDSLPNSSLNNQNKPGSGN